MTATDLANATTEDLEITPWLDGMLHS